MIISMQNCVEECIFYSLAYFICCSHLSINYRYQCFGVCFFVAREGRCKCSEVMSQFPELEELEAFVATQDLLAFESENIGKDFISEYLGDESDQRTRFKKPTTVNEIEQRT